MYTIILGIVLIAFIFVWENMWQRTLASHTKNYLFDCRDGLRTWFIENGRSLDHPTYLATRNMLNTTLWQVERVSWFNYACFRWFIKKHPDYHAQIQDDMNKRFNSPEKEINDYIDTLRDKIFYVMMTHLVFKSMILTSAFLIIGIPLIIKGCIVSIVGETKTMVIKPIFSILRPASYLVFFVAIVFSQSTLLPKWKNRSESFTWQTSQHVNQNSKNLRTRASHC